MSTATQTPNKPVTPPSQPSSKPAEKAAKARKARKPVPENETTEQKLRRLSSARVTKAAYTISLVGNLATAQYKPTKDNADKIVKALQSAVDAVKARFDAYTGSASNKADTDTGFSL